jgi:hypothetical protein
MKKLSITLLAMITVSVCNGGSASAQTDLDAIMMNKKQLCQGLTYDYSSWDHYWEGTFKRTMKTWDCLYANADVHAQLRNYQ